MYPRVSSFPGLCHFQLHKEWRGPGIFSHVCDVQGRKVVERTFNMGALGLRTVRRAKIPGNLPHIITSRGRLLYTPSIELVVGCVLLVQVHYPNSRFRAEPKVSKTFCGLVSHSHWGGLRAIKARCDRGRRRSSIGFLWRELIFPRMYLSLVLDCLLYCK